MKTTLKTTITIKDICEGFVYNELEGKGLFGLNGKLTIQPEYQRNYIYASDGGKKDTKLLDIRVFDEATKKVVYARQTDEAKKKGKSNCSYCAIGHTANKSKIWKIDEMDADHVSAWSKGGATDIKNCEMLCITHNRAKGNR